MVRISIMYPNIEGARFDWDYYIDRHMPMSIERLSSHPGYRGVAVEKGMSGGMPGTKPAYSVLCHFSFDSVESFMEAFMPHAELLQGDMANYTDIEPMIQVSEIIIYR